METPTYTKQEILRAVRDYMKSWDTGRPHLNDSLGLVDMEAGIIGIIESSLPEKRSTPPVSTQGARVGKIYPSKQVRA